MRHENSSILELDGKEVSEFTPSKPREKWLRKRTHVKIRVGVLSPSSLETLEAFSAHWLFPGLTERDCKPSHEWCGVHRRQPAGCDWAFHVWPSGHGDSGWGEGELVDISVSHTQAKLWYLCALFAECLMLLCRLIFTSWPSLPPVNGCTSAQRWLTAVAVSLLSSPKTNVWALGSTQSKWWSG